MPSPAIRCRFLPIATWRACITIGRDYDRSIEQSKRVLDIDPNDIEAHIVVALNLEQKREYPQAIAELEKAYELAGRNPLILGPLGSCYGGAGNKEKALGLLEGLNEAAKQAYVPPISWVMLYLGVGDVERALNGWRRRPRLATFCCVT